MAWIKRNLFFFIGGLIALGLLGAAGYYNYTSWSRNADDFGKLNDIYSTLKQLNDPQNSPGDEKIDKTKQALDQNAQLKAWLEQARTYFKPIAPIPPSTADNPVTSATFAAALQRTIGTLQHEAVSANVELPPEYTFAFQAQSTLVQFAPGSLDPLSVQLGEVKTIAEILYAAGINELDGIQRVRVSDDDAQGAQSDYISEQATTNGMAVITPYAITFRSFSPEIAQVFAGFAGSPHCFIVKSINVQPAGAAGQMAMAPPMMPNRGGGGYSTHGFNQPPMQPPYGRNPYGQSPYGQNPNAFNQVPGKGGLVTVLKEQLLRVSMEVDIVKLLPKN